MKETITTCGEILGAGLIAAGMWTFLPGLGLVAAGILLIAICFLASQ